jgi:hypothetical protein
MVRVMSDYWTTPGAEVAGFDSAKNDIKGKNGITLTLASIYMLRLEGGGKAWWSSLPRWTQIHR